MAKPTKQAPLAARRGRQPRKQSTTQQRAANDLAFKVAFIDSEIERLEEGEEGMIEQIRSMRNSVLRLREWREELLQGVDANQPEDIE